ncbi:MAG: erythromycin esterase family protein [Anaerolineaceae bacterium]|nr:MAG: erythromycin esterase family protein [Anaerolineaceae bacterium]
MRIIPIRPTQLLLWMFSGFLLAGCAPEVVEVQRKTPTLFPQAVIETTPTVDGGGSGRFVFSSYREGESGIFTMGVDGSGIVRLTEDKARLNQPAWSPDGSHIAYVRREWPTNLEIYVMKADGSDQIRLTRNFGSYDIEPDWSPDSSQIAYASSQHRSLDIYTMDLASFQQTQLTDHLGIDSSPDWSPDGEQIVYRSQRGDNNEIFIMNADGSGKRNLTDNPASDTDPTWSPDGSKIAFVSDREGFEDIYVMNSDGSDPIRLTNSLAKDTYPAWSPDGKLIAFYSDRSGNFDIYVMNANGTNQIQITEHEDFDGFPDWQPQPSRLQAVSIQPPYTINQRNITWLRQNAIQIPSITPRAYYDDLLLAKNVFKDIRVVGLGESAHGTRESILLKLMLVEFLITEFDFNRIIFAIDWETANLLNDYLQNTEGLDDPAEILATLNDASWSTEEMTDLFTMLHYVSNAQYQTWPSVTVAGYHNLSPDLPMDQVIEFLKRVDPAVAEQALERYDCFRRYAPNWFMYAEVSHDQKLKCSDDLKFVYEDLIANQDEYEIASSLDEFSFALLSAQLVAHFEAPYRTGAGEILLETANIRNAAESIQWLVEEGGGENKAIIWTDNIAIADVDTSSAGFPVSLGDFLKVFYGDDLLSIGFAFNSGSVNARTFGMGNPIMPQDVHPSPEGSFEWIAHQLGWPAFLLDLRGIDLSHPGAIWLDQPLYLHSIGEYYRDDDPEAYLIQFHLPTTFDAILYIDEVTPSHLLPSPDE